MKSYPQLPYSSPMLIKYRNGICRIRFPYSTVGCHDDSEGLKNELGQAITRNFALSTDPIPALLRPIGLRVLLLPFHKFGIT